VVDRRGGGLLGGLLASAAGERSGESSGGGAANEGSLHNREVGER